MNEPHVRRSRRRAPQCEKCGSRYCHVVERAPGDRDGGHRWLCGSCELLEQNPDLPKSEAPTVQSRRKLPPQKESLF
jgi:hypothetical protein